MNYQVFELINQLALQVTVQMKKKVNEKDKTQILYPPVLTDIILGRTD